jgi:hypothetical protein
MEKKFFSKKFQLLRRCDTILFKPFAHFPPFVIMAAIDTEANFGVISAAWKGLKDAGQWVLLELDGNVLSIAAQGSGGINEMRSKLDPAKIQWGGFAVTAVDEMSGVTTRSSNRVSFTFLGENMNAVKKSQASQQKGIVKDKAFPGNNATLDLTEPDELSPQSVADKLSKRSHKPKSFDFGGGVVVEL